MRIGLSATAVAGAALAVTLAAAPADASQWHSVAEYHLDHASPLVDSSGNGLNGVLKDVKVVPGHDGIGHALSFNGKTSYGLVNHSDLLNPGDSIVLVSVWLQTTDRNVNEQDWDILKYGYSASSPGLLTLEYYNDGTVSFGAKGDEHKAHVRGGPNLADGKWHEVIGEKDDGAIYLYVDRKLVASKKVQIGKIENANNLVIGAHRGPTPSEHFHGNLDEVTVQTWSS